MAILVAILVAKQFFSYLATENVSTSTQHAVWKILEVEVQHIFKLLSLENTVLNYLK